MHYRERFVISPNDSHSFTEYGYYRERIFDKDKFLPFIQTKNFSGFMASSNTEISWMQSTRDLTPISSVEVESVRHLSLCGSVVQRDGAEPPTERSVPSRCIAETLSLA